MRLFKKGDRVKVTFDNSPHIVLEDQKPGYAGVMLDHFTLSGMKGECRVNSAYLKLIVPEQTEPAKAPEQPELKAGMFVEHKRYGIAKIEDRMGGLFLKIPGFISIIAAQPETLYLQSAWTQEKLKADYHAARKRVWEESEAGKAAREMERMSPATKLLSSIKVITSDAMPKGVFMFGTSAEKEYMEGQENRRVQRYKEGDLLYIKGYTSAFEVIKDFGGPTIHIKNQTTGKESSAPRVLVRPIIDARVSDKGKILNAKAPDIYAQTAEAMFKGADRHNSGKLQWSLVDFTALEPMVRVLMKGAKKYSPDNWKKGLSYTSILDSTMRHMTAFKAGEDLDPETGEPHTAHMLCNLMFLAWEELNRKDLDNRKPDLSK